MIRRNPTRIELTLDDIEEYKNLRGNGLFIKTFFKYLSNNTV